MALAKLEPLNKQKAALSSLYKEHEMVQTEYREFHNKHAKIFAHERELSTLIGGIQDRIKAIVRLFYVGRERGAYEDFRGAVLTVIVTAKYSETIDADALVEALPALKSVPGVVVTTTTIDKEKIKALIALGEISAETVARFTKREQATSAVTFKPTEA